MGDGGERVFGLNNKIAVVVGGRGGIGRAICAEFAASGATVWAADMACEEASEPDRGGDDDRGPTQDFEVDIRSDDSVRALADSVKARTPHIDLLVNAFGINSKADPRTVRSDVWIETLNVNLNGVVRVCREFYPLLEESGHACVINFASTAAYVPVRYNAHYGASKAALVSYTRSIASEWARDGIRANAIAPTIVPTGMNAAMRQDADYVRDKVAAIPPGRMVTAREVALSARFLASDAAEMITGQVIVVDGGVLVRGEQ